MKKTMIAVALLGSLGLAGTASAFEASQVFTWSGTVPAAPVSNGWVIAQPNGNAIVNGILTFTADNLDPGKGKLTGSTELRFNVFKEDSTLNKPLIPLQAATAYKYKLTSLAVNSAGLAAEQPLLNGYYAIQASNAGVATKMVKDNVSSNVSGETILSVVEAGSSTPVNKPNLGDSVDVQATIVVENVTI